MASRIGQVEVSLLWEGAQASHCDRRYFDRLNSWRDYFPGDLGEQLNVAEIDQLISYQAEAGELVEAYDERQVHRIKRSQFQTTISPGLVITPQRGRFYPRNLVSGISSYLKVIVAPYVVCKLMMTSCWLILIIPWPVMLSHWKRGY